MTLRRLLPKLALPAVTWLAINRGWASLAGGLVLAFGLMPVWRGASGDWRERLLVATPRLTVSLSLVVLIALAPHPAVAVALAVLYAVWLLAESVTAAGSRPLVLIAAAHFLLVWALFATRVFWSWPMWLVLALIWLGSYGLALGVLKRFGEPAAEVLAATWALITSEVTWVFSVWLVSYILAGGAIIVPQATVVITGLAYSFGGIYLWHQRKKLSKARLGEYLVIALILLTVVISGTNWRGTI